MVNEELVYLEELLGRLQKGVETLKYSYVKCEAIGIKNTCLVLSAFIGVFGGSNAVFGFIVAGTGKSCPGDAKNVLAGF